MNFYNIDVVLQEVPGEISICFNITGCNLRCKGCHSPFLWKIDNGEELTSKVYLETLSKYKNFATCVLFMGGEWHQEELIKNLRIAKKSGYKTCLYTGLDINDISPKILKQLTWLKYGQWKEQFGGLDSDTSNQKFIEIKTHKILNHLFKI